MDFVEYIPLAQVTANPQLSHTLRFRVAWMGLAGEMGEVADLLKKVLGHGHPSDTDEFRTKLVKELGDVCWYVAEVASLRSGIGQPPISPRALWGSYTSTPFIHDVGDIPEQVAVAMAAITNVYEEEFRPTDIGMENRVAMLVTVLQTVFGIGFFYGIGMSEILETNIAKLRLRYPGGFTEFDSQNRASTDV